MKKLTLWTLLFFFSVAGFGKDLKSTKVKPVSTEDGGSSFFNLSLIPDIAVFGRHTKITGLTISVWGENEQHSLALGIINGSVGNSGGVSFGILNYSENYVGVQLSVANWAMKDFTGLQWGVLNYAGESFTGMQLGLCNYVGKLKGLQLGLINYAKSSESGVQVGLVNIMEGNKNFFSDFPKEVAPVLVVANWGF